MTKANLDSGNIQSEGTPFVTMHELKYWVITKNGIIISDPEDHDIPIFTTEENLMLFLNNQGVSQTNLEIKELNWKDLIALVQRTSPHSNMATIDHRGEIGFYECIPLPQE